MRHVFFLIIFSDFDLRNRKQKSKESSLGGGKELHKVERGETSLKEMEQKTVILKKRNRKQTDWLATYQIIVVSW